MPRDERIIAQANFDERVVRYIVVSAIIPCVATIFGIFLLPIVLLIAHACAKVYFARLRCVLTDRNLQIDKGVLVRTESTIPLDKITDMQMVQGPIMRMIGIHGLKVETAGQGAATGGFNATVLGVIDARAFRDLVLTERDRVTDLASRHAPHPAPAEPALGDADMLRDIRDSLHRIERHLADRA